MSWRVVKTICHCTQAVEMNDPALSLRACQTVSTNGESDGLVCSTKLTALDRTPATWSPIAFPRASCRHDPIVRVASARRHVRQPRPRPGRRLARRAGAKARGRQPACRTWSSRLLVPRQLLDHAFGGVSRLTESGRKRRTWLDKARPTLPKQRFRCARVRCPRGPRSTSDPGIARRRSRGTLWVPTALAVPSVLRMVVSCVGSCMPWAEPPSSSRCGRRTGSAPRVRGRGSGPAGTEQSRNRKSAGDQRRHLRGAREAHFERAGL
jgi:hypothetical protein